MNNNIGPTLGRKPLGRIGYGAMRLPGIRDVPEDIELARTLLSRAVMLGANVIDTADFYGRGLANRLIAEALSPYPDSLIIATKVGVKAGAGGRPEPAATPDEIRATVERNLETLGVQRLDLVFLRLAGGPLANSGVPIQESLECLAVLQAQGLIEHIGLSSATVEQIEVANTVTAVEAVQNAYFIGNADSSDVLRKCSDANIPFFSYFPLGMGNLIPQNANLSLLAASHDATESQIALAWLLALSPMMVSIPGTSKVKHLEENMAAVNVTLSPSEVGTLSNVA
jgi:aryl-alcohol dehydrogenase-like predicted oxidoreductase